MAKVFRKCKSATFQIGSDTYTIGKRQRNVSTCFVDIILYTQRKYSSSVVVGSRFCYLILVSSLIAAPTLILFCPVRDARISFRPVDRYTILYHETDEEY